MIKKLRSLFEVAILGKGEDCREAVELTVVKVGFVGGDCDPN